MKKLTDLIAKYGDKEIDETKFKELFDIKESKVFMPKLGERYWFVGTHGQTYHFKNEYKINDREIIEYNEVYRTKEEAEFARDKRAFMMQMERDFADNSDEIDWDDIKQKKCFLYFNNKEGVIETDWWTITQYDMTYTTNEKWLKQWVKDNEADIKKYVFEIKEDK